MVGSEAVPPAGRALSTTDLPLYVQGLNVAYGSRPVLWNVEFSAAAGSLTAVVGPNGAGKSTLLRAVIGQVPRLSGHVRVFGRQFEPGDGTVAYVPQQGVVDWEFPASALDVVAMGLYGDIGWFRPVRRRHRTRALEMLDRVGLADSAGRQIGQLSGGQRQRMFVARALAQDAEIYLLDEPLAGVDAVTETRIMTILRELADAGRTIVVVHHDLETLQEYFTHALLLNGRVVEAGPVGGVVASASLSRTYGRFATAGAGIGAG
ncbi:MAG: ABC transporter ATP-binding protein [Alphaproteobacteria bacterium]|nr:ABC transporter ATP-binding protein [Alphaproteobacteria bacterium]